MIKKKLSLSLALIVLLFLSIGFTQFVYAQAPPPASHSFLFPKHPTCSITYTPTNPNTSSQTNFNSHALAYNGKTISSVAWVFGDGGTGSGITSSHQYTTVNTFTVNATVTDSAGRTGSCSRSITTAIVTINVKAVITWNEFGKERQVQMKAVLRDIK